MRNPRFDAFLKHAAELHDKKNHDYAADNNPYSNFEFAAKFAGVTVDQVFDVLIGIKQSRLVELTSAGKIPNNESIWDTKRDLAVYAMLKASYSMPAEDRPVSAQEVLRSPAKQICDKFTPADNAFSNFYLCKNCGYHYDQHSRPEPPA